MPEPHAVIDHIVVTASDLDTGVAFVRERLGIEPGPGGAHPAMGTHNRLLRCGLDCYLEVIAVNPQAPHPAQSRWFGLDQKEPDSAPSLSAWVVRSTDIHTQAAASAEPLGPVTPMQRGHLDWLITIPASGVAPLDGLAPALIEWQTPERPVLSMPDHGLALEALHIYHPQPQRLITLAASLNLHAPLSVFPSTPDRPAGLRALIRTPQGLCELG